jgi:hypothetical protein
MQQTGQTAGWSGAERKRVAAIVETLANSLGGGETLEEVAHDARNMVTALLLYCDLLEAPGVLATSYLHYGNELRLVAAASRRLVEKLGTLDAGRGLATALPAFRQDDSEKRGMKLCGAHRQSGSRLAGEPEPARGARRPLDRANGDDRSGSKAGVAHRGGSDPGAGEPGEECRRGHARRRQNTVGFRGASGGGGSLRKPLHDR